MISDNSSDAPHKSIVDTSEESEVGDDKDDGDGGDAGNGEAKLSNITICAALVAAVWMSRGDWDAGRGKDLTISGKLSMAELPLMLRAATSWARAAISAVGNVPSHIRDFLRGSRISETHLPQFLILTPR